VPNSHAALSPTVDSSTDPLDAGHPENPALALPLTQAMYTHIIQYMQSQNHYRQMKLEYLRRRQEREEAESIERRNIERARHELEISEMERRRQTEIINQKQEWAYQAVNNPRLDPGVKQAATEFLKSLFS
jgi:histone acetyltransferase MYST4